VCLALIGAVVAASAGGLDDLLGQKDLTPESLAHGFAHFAFELAPQLQEPETFLQRHKGDCADYSNLASTVLNHRGYTTKMVVVMMAQQTHVVCFVKEAGGFLDYNHRADEHPLIPSDGSLEDIANKVARDFRSQWRMASAFHYRSGAPVYLDSVFATAASDARATTRAETRKRVVSAKKLASPAGTVGPVQASTAMVGDQTSIN